jgi:hypothetical protein
MEEDNAITGRRSPKSIILNHYVKGRFRPTHSKQLSIPPQSNINVETVNGFLHTLLAKFCDERPSWPCAALSASIFNFVVQNDQHITTFFTRAGKLTEEVGKVKDCSDLLLTYEPQLNKEETSGPLSDRHVAEELHAT